MSRAKYIVQKMEENGFPLNIVETGTLRNVSEQYAIGDGHSTYWIAKCLKENDPGNKSNFWSIDLSTKVCEQFMGHHGLEGYVKLIQDDSRKALSRLNGPFDIAYLDSANDDSLILEEFKIVAPKVKDGGLIIIDDCYPGNERVIKGNKVIPYAIKEGYQVEVNNGQGTIIC